MGVSRSGPATSCGSNITSIDSHPLWLNDAFELQVMDEIVLLTWTKKHRKIVGSALHLDERPGYGLYSLYLCPMETRHVNEMWDVSVTMWGAWGVSTWRPTVTTHCLLYLHDTISADLAAGMHRQNWYVVRERRVNLPIFQNCMSFNVPNSHQLISSRQEKVRTFFVTAGNNPDTFMLMSWEYLPGSLPA